MPDALWGGKNKPYLRITGLVKTSTPSHPEASKATVGETQTLVPPSDLREQELDSYHTATLPQVCKDCQKESTRLFGCLGPETLGWITALERERKKKKEGGREGGRKEKCSFLHLHTEPQCSRPLGSRETWKTKERLS
jgi:hypothetical protein